MKYEMEELIPIVAALADQYTSKESTSISYERASHLMEAVLYCIDQCREGRQLTDSRGLTAREAYECGYELVMQKVKRTQELYNEMIMDFCAYGNENYRVTVEKAIPGFFRYYNAKFAPQETIITMDYPTIRPIADETGINAVAKYVEYISYEQRFLRALPQEYEALSNLVIERDTDCLEKRIMKLLHQLIFEKYKGGQMLECYLQADIRNFVIEMQNAARSNVVKRVVVL